MLPQARDNRLRLIAALNLLAVLLAVAPGHARAAGAALCNANSVGMNRAPLDQATEPHQAALVIDFGDGRVMTFCIDLGADGQATGEELLRASNLPVIFEYSGNGGAVCKIDTVGSNFPAEPCFSHCTLQPGETCMYWSYSQLVGDHWQFSQVGASSTVVHSGDVNGWAWGESTIARGAQPPLRTLAEICLPATVTPTASLTPTPTVTPTATLPPTAPPATTTPYVARIITATPTASATPTSTPTASPVVAPAAPTPSTSPSTGPEGASGQASAPAQATAPAALPSPSPTVPAPPTAAPSATPLPPPTSTAAADTPIPESTNRSSSGSLRIQLPLIQHAGAATPSATTRPTARAETFPAALPSATPAPATATPMPRPLTPDDDPTRNYPYFGGTAVFLLAGWAMLRRGRGRRAA
jgi:hypothetical protein